MCSRVLVILVVAVSIYFQGRAAGEVYTAELFVESNVSLEARTVLSILHELPVLQIINSEDSHEVTLSQHEVVAECHITGDESICTCSVGYIWSNEVCYASGCCNESACMKNVHDITPLCIVKAKVRITGSVILSTGASWDDAKTTKLVTAFRKMNAFESLNITGHSLNNASADFEAAVSVKFMTSKLQDVVTTVETILSAVVWVNTEGMVTTEYPGTLVDYMSNPQLKCTFEEVTGSAGWNMTRNNERYELNNGTVVKLEHNCATKEKKSCIAVTLQGVTSTWTGTYECGFTSWSVRHTAKIILRVALLPDVITTEMAPLTIDCSDSSEVNVNVTVIIPHSTQSFEVSWENAFGKQSILSNKSYEDYLGYNFKTPVRCQKTTGAQYVAVTFKNIKGQKKDARMDIPVIYADEKFCSGETINGDFWPKTPAGHTVIIRTCAEGKVGYKSRTCQGTNWQLVVSQCVKKQLNKVQTVASNFQKGLGTSQKMAMDIFEGLKNSSFDYDSNDTMGDISVSIQILSLMADASQHVDLHEDVLHDFVVSASNMLNTTWDWPSSSVHNMSSNYLQSVETLVKNIKVDNNFGGVQSPNLDLKFCSSSDCNVSVFDISMTLNKTSVKMKTVAVKNLTDKLRNNFPRLEHTSLIISVTLEDNSDPYLGLTLDFPYKQLKHMKPVCVFWNPTNTGWSEAGCTVNISDSHHTICACNHLTSFSALMARTDTSNEVLDIITYVGLCASICSLLIFLIIESIVWSVVVKTNLSHFRHTALVNIAVFLLLADCSFLASTSPEILPDTWCLILALCKHLFFMAMFSWMLCLSIMLVHQLIFVFSPLRKRVFMFFSSIIGYVCPILIVGSSYMYSKYTNKRYYDKEKCWLVYEKILQGSLHAFLLPVGTIVLTNLFSMVVTILMLVKSSVPDGAVGNEKETAKSILKVVVFLTPVFGVTWGIGFLLYIYETNDSLYHVAEFSFTILNSFQGLFVLVTVFFAERRVQEELWKFIMAKTKGKSDKGNNFTSYTYTKDK